MSSARGILVTWVGLMAFAVGAAPLHAQRVQFPGAPPPPTSGGLVPVPSAGGATTPLPGTAPFSTTAPSSTVPTLPSTGTGATLGTPAFDPYATSPPVSGTPPTSAPWNTMPPSSSPLGTTPPATSPYGAPPPGAPGAAWPYGSATQPPPGAYPGYGPTTGQADSLFPNGFMGPNNGPAPLRLLDDLRIRDTWTAGGDGLDVGMNDTEVGVDVQFPNFFGTSSPLVISPQFAMHLWDGPKGSLTQDLPGAAYSALVEAAWNSDPALLGGANIAVSVGVYSDFNAITTDSIRIQTMSYGWIRLTPQMMLKLGVNYIDRVDLALLPAVGLLWEPNPQTRFDIFFPKPKLSRHLSTVGTTDVWWYIAGEYGNGSWTIERAAGGTDQVDINDIRLMFGFDWFGQSGTRGMLEAGWVTSREVVYRYNPADNFKPSDTFMIRAGLAF